MLLYTDIMQILGLASINQNDLQYILNKNLKNNYFCIYAGKQIIRIDDMQNMPSDSDDKSKIKFHPLNKQESSSSHLLIDDSIHLYLRNLTYNIFNEVITTKESTKYKLSNLFNIITATSFSKNLISFEIDFTNSPKSAKVNFKYPLYDMLSTMHNNTIFGIHLEDDEIKLFKQIYENYIIKIIDDLFKEPIKIPAQSDHYSQFYTLMTIKLMLEETYWKKYNMCFINCKRMLPKYKEMLSDLNHCSYYDEFTRFDDIYTDKDRELDEEAYKNELQIRKESEPNWLLLKDNEMGKNEQQLAVTEKNNIRQIIDRFGQLIEYDSKQYLNKIRKFNTDILVQEYKDNYQKFKNNQEWNEIFYWQNIVLDILRNNGGGLWFDTRIKKYCFCSKFNASTVEVDSNELGDLLTRALKDKIKDYSNQNKNVFISN